MLSCPNEGSEYLRSIRAAVGFGHHPQAGQLDVLAREVGEARRIGYATVAEFERQPPVT
jgi:hypothetical protein